MRFKATRLLSDKEARMLRIYADFNDCDEDGRVGDHRGLGLHDAAAAWRAGALHEQT